MYEDKELIWAKAKELADFSPDTVVAKEVNKTLEVPSKTYLYFKKARPYIASLFWIYSILQIFILNLDVLLLSMFDPNLIWILNFKFVLVIIFIAFLFLFLKTRRTLSFTAYIIFFPLILIVWKIPKMFWKIKNSVLLITIIQTIFGIVVNLRSFFIGLFAMILSIFLIFYGQKEFSLIGIIILIVLYLIFTSRTIFRLLTDTPFSKAQTQITDLLSKQTLKAQQRAAAREGKIDLKQLEHWGTREANEFISSAGFRVFGYRILRYTAASFAEYNKSPVRLISILFTIIYFFISTLFTFSMINFVILQISPTEFSFNKMPSFIQIVNYTLSSIYAGETSNLQAIGLWSISVKILTTILGAIVFLTFIVSFILSFRQAKEEKELENLASAFNQKAEEYKAIIVSNEGVTPEELQERIRETKWNFIKGLDWLASRS